MSELDPVTASPSERVLLRRRIATLLWRALALVSLLLGAIGAMLPVLPTVPFLLLAAWAASKGWPALEIWLLNHRRLGPPLVQWRRRRSPPELRQGRGRTFRTSSSTCCARTRRR